MNTTPTVSEQSIKEDEMKQEEQTLNILARFRERIREPGMLIPGQNERLSRMGVVYYSDDTELPEDKKEVVVKNTMNTPTQVVTVDKEKVDAANDSKAKKNLLYLGLAAIVGYFFYTKAE